MGTARAEPIVPREVHELRAQRRCVERARVEQGVQRTKRREPCPFWGDGVVGHDAREGWFAVEHSERELVARLEGSWKRPDPRRRALPLLVADEQLFAAKQKPDPLIVLRLQRGLRFEHGAVLEHCGREDKRRPR